MGAVYARLYSTATTPAGLADEASGHLGGIDTL